MSSRRHWSVEDDYDSYSYSRPTRYSNVSSNVYVTPQRYVPSVSESYSPVGKTYIRSIPAVAHQRLTTTSYPPRSYVPTHYDEERILGYRSPPSSHHITTTSYRPYLDDEPQIEYIPWQPRQYEYRATPSYTDTWKSHISPQTKARWSALLEDEDDWLTHEKSVARRSDTMVPYHRPAMITAPVHTSYADRYQRELEDSMSEFSGAVIPSSTFMSKHSIYPQTKPITHRPIKPRGHMDDHHADEYPAHGRKYVVLPMQKVFNDIYNMSFYRKPMREANIGFKKHQPYIPSGAGHLACVRFVGGRAVHPTRPERSYHIDPIPREVARLSLYGGMIAAVRDHRLVRVSIHPIQWRDDEGAPKKSRVLDISVEPSPRNWRFMGGDGGIGEKSDKIVEITDSKPVPRPKKEVKVEAKPAPKVERRPLARVEPKVEPKPVPKEEPKPVPKEEPKPEPIPEPEPEPVPEPPKEPEPQPEKAKKKRSKGSAAEPPKEEPKPEPPKEEPKPEPPKEEPKPEPPKEEPKPEPPKEEPKPEPEPPKEEPKPEPPKEEPKPEPPKEPTPEPPKEEPAPEPEPPKEEPQPEPPKEEPKVEPEPPKEPEPQPPVEEAKPEVEPPKEESAPEAPTEEPVVEPSTEIPQETPAPEPVPEAPAAEEPPKEEPTPEAPKEEAAPEAPKEEPAPEAPKEEPAPEAPKEEPAPEAPKEEVAEAPSEAPVTEEVPKGEEDDVLSPEQEAAANQARLAARRVSAFDEDPKWLESLSEGGSGGAQN